MNETVPKPNDGAAIPLPTALDIAQAKQKYDSTPLTTEFFRVLRSGSRHFPPEMLREGKAVKVSAQTLEVIGFAIGTSPRFSGEPLFTDEEISTLKDLQSRMEATVKLAEEFSLAKVNDHIHKKRDAVHAAIDSGEQVGDMSIPTREQVTAEFRMKLNGYTSVLDRITRQEVLPLVTPMLERFEHGLEDFMRENEVGDRELCTAYGLDFAPGLLWQAAAVVAQQHNVKRKIGFTGWRTPKEILGPLVEL